MSKKSPALSSFIAKSGFVFISGQIALTAKGEMLEGSIQDQTHQVMKNAQSVLKEAGTSFDNVVKTTIYVTNMSMSGEINDIYATYFKEPYPAREMIGVKELPLGAKLEISMIAVKS